jgi:hypothetical protein
MAARRPVALVAAAIALAIGACGSGGDEARRDNRYVDTVNRVQADFVRTVDRIPIVRATDGAPAGQRALSDYVRAVDRVVARLRSVVPPKRLAAGHRRLVGALLRFRSRLGSAAASLGSGDPNRVTLAQQAVLAARDDAQRALNREIAAINHTLHS